MSDRNLSVTPCRIAPPLVEDDDFAGQPALLVDLALGNGSSLTDVALLRVRGERPGEPLGLGTLLNFIDAAETDDTAEPSAASPKSRDFLTYLWRGQLEVMPLAWIECIEVSADQDRGSRGLSASRPIMARLGLRSGRTLAGLLEVPVRDAGAELAPNYLCLATASATVWVRRAAVHAAVAVGLRPTQSSSLRRRETSIAEFSI